MTINNMTINNMTINNKTKKRTFQPYFCLLTLWACFNTVSAQDIFTNQFEPLIAMRTAELSIADPHIFTLVAGIACIDITNQVNTQVQTSIDSDGDGDGFLDVNNIIQFSTDQVDDLTTTPLLTHAVNAQCPDPLHSEPCNITAPSEQQLITTPADTGNCLTIETGTTSNYTPAPNTTSAPCYVTDPVDTVINLAGIDVTVQAFQSANRYQLGLTTDQGLNKAFIAETDAENIIFPAETPVIGGSSLASLLPGGTGNCSSNDDRDLFIDNQTMGWWFYFNTTAEIVELQ